MVLEYGSSLFVYEIVVFLVLEELMNDVELVVLSEVSFLF